MFTKLASLELITTEWWVQSWKSYTFGLVMHLSCALKVTMGCSFLLLLCWKYSCFVGWLFCFLFGSGGVKALVIFPHQYIGPGEVLSSLRHKAFISLKLFLIIDFEIQLYANDSNDIFERVGCHTKNRVSIWRVYLRTWLTFSPVNILVSCTVRGWKVSQVKHLRLICYNLSIHQKIWND